MASASASSVAIGSRRLRLLQRREVDSRDSISGSEDDSSPACSPTYSPSRSLKRSKCLSLKSEDALQASFMEMLIHIEGLQRKKTAALLFFGSFFGFLGFCFAWLIGFIQFVQPSLSDDMHIPTAFQSGKGYFPATVSEMVHDPNRPAGKCFFAFEFIAAIFIFQSWYPWHLRNVYIGDDAVVPYTTVSWMMFRQIVPSTGMMIVATVTSTPVAQATLLDWVCIYIHLTGAVMLFGGYWLVEAYTLGWGRLFPLPKVAKQTIRGTQLMVRKWLATAILVSYLLFISFQGLLLIDMSVLGGTVDQWTMVSQNSTATMVDLAAGASGANATVLVQTERVMLAQTASGWVLRAKLASYVCEVCCGFALLASLLSIWWFSEERHADLREGLWKMVPADADTPASSDQQYPV